LLAEEIPSDSIPTATAAWEPTENLSETGIERLNDIVQGAGVGASTRAAERWPAV
jgi:hypothetical protein